MHDNIVDYQTELILIYSNIDLNRNNSRLLTTYQRQFDHKKIKLDNKIKELYHLSDIEDEIVPIIGDLYESN